MGGGWGVLPPPPGHPRTALTLGEEFAGYRDSQAVAEAEVRSLLSTGHTSDGLPLDAADRMELQRLLVC